MSAKIRQGLRGLASARGVNGDVYKELCTLVFGEKPETEHRAVAIVGAAILEEALRKAIEAHLIPNRTRDTDIQLFEDEQAPLQGLAARTRMAIALGIINEGVKSGVNGGLKTSQLAAQELAISARRFLPVGDVLIALARALTT